MADIELIIKIPEEVYKNIQSKSTEIQAEGYTVENTILNGTPLNEVLDNIRAEIEDTLYVDSLIFGELIDFLNGKISADDVIEEFNRVTRLEVLKIINKYRGESDCHSCKTEYDCYECEKYEESEDKV